MKSNRTRVVVIAFLTMAFISVLFAACARPGTGATSDTGSTSGGSGGSTGSTASSSGNTVHMGAANFIQSTITITKGSSLTLVDDVTIPHVIQNGSWDNGTAKPAKESGAPTVAASFSGNDSHTVGPFNTAGTFKLYCTIHSGMNLTVTVQ